MKCRKQAERRVVEQVEAFAKDGQLLVAILHRNGRRYTGCLVMLRLKDFVGYVNGGVE